MEIDPEKNKGRSIEEQRKKRHAGKTYLKRNKTEVGHKNPPNEQVRKFRLWRESVVMAGMCVVV